MFVLEYQDLLGVRYLSYGAFEYQEFIDDKDVNVLIIIPSDCRLKWAVRIEIAFGFQV